MAEERKRGRNLDTDLYPSRDFNSSPLGCQTIIWLQWDYVEQQKM